MEHNQKPIDQFLQHANSNMDMLYEAMPYVNMSFKKPLAVYLKMQEMQEIIRGFDNSETLSACGLNEANYNMEDMIAAMRKKATGKPAAQLDMILNVIQATKVYRTYQQLLASNNNNEAGNLVSDGPNELLNLIQQSMKGNSDESQMA